MTDDPTQADPPPLDESVLLEESAVLERVRELEEANAALRREVQEGRLLERALRESEERLQDLALTTADWLWEVDAGGRYTACSDRVTDVLGYTPKEIIGRSPFDLMAEEDVGSRHAGVRAHAQGGHRLLGTQEPQPAQGRPRGRAAHELRADVQRGR